MDFDLARSSITLSPATTSVNNKSTNDKVNTHPSLICPMLVIFRSPLSSRLCYQSSYHSKEGSGCHLGFDFKVAAV